MPNLAAVLPRMTRRVTTYGLDSPAADVTATDVALGPLSVTATVKRRARGSAGAPDGGDRRVAHVTLGTLTLAVPGRHNLLNALAAVAVGLELGLSFERIAAGLEEFRGAERRFDVRGEPNGILVVDDYGHHPTEIAAVLAAARTLGRRIVVAFQPHRFTRTAALMDAFGPALAGADHIVLTDIYAAGEEPIPGVTLEALARGDPPQRRPRRSTSCRASTTSCRRSCASRGPATSSSRSAPARSARVPDRAASTAELGEATRHEPGRRAADRRFRRAHVKPARRTRSWRGAGGAAADLGGRSPPALIYGVYRDVGGRGARARAAGRSDRRPRQRAAVEGRGARGAERAARREPGVDRSRRAGAQRLLASPWVRDAALRRSLPSTVEVVVSERQPIGIGRINARPVSGRRARRDHRRVRPAVRRPRSADRRRPVGGARRRRRADRRRRAPSSRRA